MSDVFNPYHEWLGLPPQTTRPNFYQMLGLAIGESDKQRIKQAAAAAIENLEQVDPGNFGATRKRLIGQVEQIEGVLLDDDQRRGYNKRIAAAVKRKKSKASKSQSSTDKTKKAKKAGKPQKERSNRDLATADGQPDQKSTSATAESSSVLNLNEQGWPPGVEPVDSTLNESAKSDLVSDDHMPGEAALPVPALPGPAPRDPVAASVAGNELAAEFDLPASIPKTDQPQSNQTDFDADLPAPLPQHLSSDSAQSPNQSELSQPAIVPEAIVQPTAVQPDSIQPDNVQPAAVRQVATIQPMAVQPANVQDNFSSPIDSPSLGVETGATPTTERYRKQRRQSRIKTAIASICGIAVVGACSWFAWQHRDTWLPNENASGGQTESDDSGMATVVDVPTRDTVPDSSIEKSIAEEAAKVADVPGSNPDMSESERQVSLDVEDASAASDKVDPSEEMVADNRNSPVEETPAESPAVVSPVDHQSLVRQLVKLEELGGMLMSARLALFERKLDEADSLIANAESLAEQADHRLKVDRMRAMAKQIGKFWDTVQQESSKLKSLDEIELTTSIISVIENGDDGLAYRFNGQRRVQKPRELPLGLAMKIAERAWSEPTRESELMRGSVYAINSQRIESYAAKAREIFEAAEKDGANVDLLTGWLDDDYDLVTTVIVQSDVPDEELIATAGERLKNHYRNQFSSDSKDAKSLLAKKILDEAIGHDDAAERYAAFELAAMVAAGEQNVVLLVEVIQAQGKWFKVDSMDVQATELEKILKRPIRRSVAKDLSISAFQLVQEARDANNQTHAARFAKIAISAAAKSKDDELLLRAAELKSELKLAD